MGANFSYSERSSPRFSCTLEPKQVQAGEEIRVHIENTGYRSDVFTVTARSRQMEFLPEEKQTVRIHGGKSATLNFTVQPSGKSIIGSKGELAFRILVQASGGQTKVLKGKLRSQALLSFRQGLIVLVLLLSVFFISRKAKGADGGGLFSRPTETPTPTLTPLPTLTPTPQPHAGEVLYLSFDDGPSVWTPEILATLAKYDVKATFFIIGQQVQEFEDVILAEASAGHVIAHHTWSHISVNGIGFDAFAEQIYMTNAVLPVEAAPCVRLPFADEGAYTEDYAAEMGLQVIWWNVDPMDWNNPGRQNIEYTVLSEAADGEIILLHDGGGNRAQTVAALDKILQELTAQGYRFETLCR